MDINSGLVFCVRCNNSYCEHCLLIKVKRRAAAIAAAEPDWEMVVTRVILETEPYSYHTVLKRMNRLKQDYLRHPDVQDNPRFQNFEWVWFVEQGDAEDYNGVYHVHAAVKSIEINHAAMAECSAKRGMGMVRVPSRIQNADAMASYFLKLAREDRVLFKHLNSADGDRLYLGHASRGFYDGKRVRDAERDAVQALMGLTEPPRWAFIRD